MSAYFDGTTSYSYKTGLLPSTAVPLTISCWINPTSQTSAAIRGLVRLGLPAATATNRDVVRLFLNTTGTLAAQAADSAGANASTTTALVQAGVWNHCLGVFASNTSRTAYLNAVAATTNTNSRTITTGATQLGIGASIYNSLASVDNFFEGAIAHVAIWDEELSTREIVALSRGFVDPRTVRPNALRYYNPLVAPVNAPAEAIVNRAWTSWNQVKHPYTNGEDPGAQVFVNIARSNNNPFIYESRPTAKIYQFAPQPVNVTVSVTGVSATGAVGTATVSTSLTQSVTGQFATGQVGTVTTAQNVDYTVTGQFATGQVGTVTVAAGQVVPVTGVFATGQVGTVTTAQNVDYTVAGQSATGAVGTPTVSTNVTLTTDSVFATGQVGAVTTAQNVDYTVTGQSATGQVGAVTTAQNVDYTVTGQSATGAVGTPTVIIGQLVTTDSVFATGQVGAVTTAQNVDYTVTGQSATGALGAVTTAQNVDYTVTGVKATGAVGTVTTLSSITELVTGQSATGQVGAVTTVQNINYTVTGQSATGAVGNVTVLTTQLIVPTGVASTGAVGDVDVLTPVPSVYAIGKVGVVIVWTPITPDQNAGWAPVDDSQSGAWTPVDDSNTVLWQKVA
jgi:hypothetical protein